MDMNKDQDVSALISETRAGSDSAFYELVKRYTPLMNKVVSGFTDAKLSYDDMFAEATVALHTAAMRFDLDQDGVTFGLFARICIQHRIIDHLRREEPSPELVDVDVDGVESDEMPEDGIVSRERMAELLSSAQRSLSEYEYRVLILHIQGFKTAAIAAKLGKDSKSVDNAKSRIFRRLRRLYGGNGDF